MAISILILTLNEEINISDCIDSVFWSDDIVVLDSMSCDRTVEIAKVKGARIIERKFDDWSSHQNWAMESIEFKNPWVFYIDADERCSRELADEIQAAVGNDDGTHAYRLRRRDMFMGKWLKHAQLYPTWFVRLFRPECIRFERLVNPVPIVKGEIGNLKNDLIHYPFSHGVTHWLSRHNKYSDMEALETIISMEGKKVSLADILSTDLNSRRSALKRLFFRMPLRPIIKFFYYYFVRRGFLDGKPGFTYSILQSFYEYMIVLKTKEITRRQKGLPM